MANILEHIASVGFNEAPAKSGGEYNQQLRPRLRETRFNEAPAKSGGESSN